MSSKLPSNEYKGLFLRVEVVPSGFCFLCFQFVFPQSTKQKKMEAASSGRPSPPAMVSNTCLSFQDHYKSFFPGCFFDSCRPPSSPESEMQHRSPLVRYTSSACYLDTGNWKTQLDAWRWTQKCVECPLCCQLPFHRLYIHPVLTLTQFTNCQTLPYSFQDESHSSSFCSQQ